MSSDAPPRALTDAPRAAAGRATDERLLDAALACIARVGVGKTTLDDVAREADCSRATLYRYFPGKAPLLRALVEREAARLAASVDLAAADADTLDDALVASIVVAARAVTGHAALAFVVAHEPELILPALTFEGADALLARAGELFDPALRPHLPPERVGRAGEWVARIVFSYLCSPSESVDLTDAASVRSFVGELLVASLDPSSTIVRG
jgi:TetR/AcrR family transcriptional repressor of uid operon